MTAKIFKPLAITAMLLLFSSLLSSTQIAAGENDQGKEYEVHIWEIVTFWENLTAKTENIQIRIKDFFIGNLIGLDPKMPYANIEIKITPENVNYIESIVLKYESLLGKNSEVLVFDNANKSFYFSGQVRFFGSSWAYPFDTYLTELRTENAGSFENYENTIDVPGHPFLEAKISFEKDTISMKMQRNALNYLILSIILFFYALFYYTSIKYMRHPKTRKRFPLEIAFLHASPLALILTPDLLPVKSIVFIILLGSIILFWVYFLHEYSKIEHKLA